MDQKASTYFDKQTQGSVERLAKQYPNNKEFRNMTTTNANPAATEDPNINAPEDLSDDPIPTNFEDLPEQMVAREPLPQPGAYRFQLPAVIEASDFEQYGTPNGPRMRLNVKKHKALVNLVTGDRFSTQLNNNDRMMGRKDDKKSGNDLAFLIKAVGGTLPPGAGNKTYRDELMKHGGKIFDADITLTARCNPNSEVYRDGQRVAGSKGCGQEYGQRTYKKQDGRQVLQIGREPNGRWAEGVTCTCGAEVSCFANLQAIREAK